MIGELFPLINTNTAAIPSFLELVILPIRAPSRLFILLATDVEGGVLLSVATPTPWPLSFSLKLHAYVDESDVYPLCVAKFETTKLQACLLIGSDGGGREQSP